MFGVLWQWRFRDFATQKQCVCAAKRVGDEVAQRWCAARLIKIPVNFDQQMWYKIKWKLQIQAKKARRWTLQKEFKCSHDASSDTEWKYIQKWKMKICGSFWNFGKWRKNYPVLLYLLSRKCLAIWYIFNTLIFLCRRSQHIRTLSALLLRCQFLPYMSEVFNFWRIFMTLCELAQISPFSGLPLPFPRLLILTPHPFSLLLWCRWFSSAFCFGVSAMTHSTCPAHLHFHLTMISLLLRFSLTGLV